MKRIAALVLLVAAAVVLSGAAKRRGFKNLEGGSLTLKDRHSNKRVHIGTAEDGSVSLNLNDKTGKTRASLNVHGNGHPRLDLLDKDGNTRIMLSEIHGDTHLVFFSKGGDTQISLQVLDNGGSLALYGTGEQKAVLGTKGTVAKNELKFFDAKGDVLWQAPR